MEGRTQHHTREILPGAAQTAPTGLRCEKGCRGFHKKDIKNSTGRRFQLCPPSLRLRLDASWASPGSTYTRGVSRESDPEVDELFRLPLERFTEARNELAARLRAQGQGDRTAQVKALSKPSASAWAANQVYWNARPAFDALIRAGGRVREAQRRGAGAEELREATRARRDALQAALRGAEEALVSAGHGASPQVLRRVSATLEALASGAGEGRAGALTGDLEAPGFEALAGLATRGPGQRPARAETAAAVEDARARASEEASRLEAEAARLQRRAEEAAAASGEARQRAEGARREVEEAQRRLDRASQRLDQAERAAQEAEAGSREAAARAAEAERKRSPR